MLVLSIDKKRELRIFLKMFVKFVWAIGLVAILSSCGTSPGYNYTISGTVSGMIGSGLVLQDNGGDNRTITGNGAFSFNTALTSGTAYSITVLAQPTNPSQTCVVSNGSGSVNGSPVEDVAVSCVMNYSSVAITLGSSSGAEFAYEASSTAGEIKAYIIDTTTPPPPLGTLTTISAYPTDTTPTFITLYPNSYSTSGPAGEYVYVSNFASNGTILFYTISSTGALTQIQTVSAGAYPTSVTVDPTGKYAYVANMGDGTISAYTTTSTSTPGALATVPGSPFSAGTSPTSVTVDPKGEYAYVANMSDGTISAYTIDTTNTATLGALDTIYGSPFSAGTYPTSVTIDPTGSFVYVANMGSNNISAYTIDTTNTATLGTLDTVSGSPFATGTNPTSVTVDPTSQFAYVSSADGNVWAYTISATSTSTPGALTTVSGSPYPIGIYPTPVTITIESSGKEFAYVAGYVASTGFYTIYAYTISSTTGALTTAGNTVIPYSPSAITVDPTGQFAYVATGDGILAYTINTTTGALTPVVGGPY